MYGDVRIYEFPEFVQEKISELLPVKIVRVKESVVSPIKSGVETYVLTMANDRVYTIQYDRYRNITTQWS